MPEDETQEAMSLTDQIISAGVLTEDIMNEASNNHRTVGITPNGLKVLDTNRGQKVVQDISSQVFSAFDED